VVFPVPLMAAIAEPGTFVPREITAATAPART
jgi:hypothetical protein